MPKKYHRECYMYTSESGETCPLCDSEVRPLVGHFCAQTETKKPRKGKIEPESVMTVILRKVAR